MGLVVRFRVDALGNPLRFLITPGQTHDSTQAQALIAQADVVLADKAYDVDALIERIGTMGACAVIPPKANRLHPRDYDKHLYSPIY